MKRFKRLSRTTGIMLGLVTSIGLAWLSAGLIEGTLTTHAGHAKKVNLPLAVTASPTEGLAPWGQEGTAGAAADEKQTMSASFTNENGVFEILGYTATVTTGNEAGCPAANFKIEGGAGLNGGGYSPVTLTYITPVKTVAHGLVQNLPNIAVMQLRPVAGEAPVACEGEEAKVHFVASSKG